MFRRGMNRPFRRFPADIPPALQRANELMATGDFNGAAAAFEQAAQAAVARWRGARPVAADPGREDAHPGRTGPGRDGASSAGTLPDRHSWKLAEAVHGRRSLGGRAETTRPESRSRADRSHGQRETAGRVHSGRGT